MKKFEEYFLLSRRITLFAEALGFYSEALPDFLPEMLYPFFGGIFRNSLWLITKMFP